MQWSASEDLDSLPPAVRRKFFSNVERMRMRLAQSDPSSPAPMSSTPNYHVRARPTRLGPGPLHSRALRNASTTSLTRRRGLEKRAFYCPRKLHKPGSLQLAYLVAQADSQCFHALPAKIQQKLFSPEERLRLRHAYRDSVILDAADEAFYRRDSSAQHRRSSTDSLPSDITLPVGQPSTSFWDSDSESDWDEVDSKMDQSLYESFRWLDEDGDLDLSLDEYHAHVADAAATKPKSRRRPSFARSLSFSTHTSLKHRPSASVPQGLPSSHSMPPFTPVINASPTSRPASRQKSSHHAPKSSTSSMDPTAQYYQDPDARLKLRVYLASPQKFDEAIEFGFPALGQDKENLAPEPVPLQPLPLKQDCVGTFFEDDDGTVVGSPGGSLEEETAATRLSSQLRETPRPSMDTPSLLQRRQSFLPVSKSGLQRLPGNREMTLKMTLTRPDLRTQSPTPSSFPQEDPLRLAALPPAECRQKLWSSDLNEQSAVRRMWRKLRRHL
ncbi:uncharacterized protein N7459_003731 [Penicillium hispanicum]|uniref:uncharacterized protein n=1 Tax=Penicillium hispanicum TaxID=1080232 RepID=UPI00253FE7CA|nr:uncharacterized protein N7459_003731 [Penicillium hispanicum]KAJ5587966.1 hypothetical protein N7459_003731 [Penicillium hispanicum]